MCRLLTALIAILGLLMAPASTAQESPQGSGAVTTRAQAQELVGDTVWRGTGEVEIHYQDITIRCDTMDYDQESMELVARGNVILDRGPSRFSCAELRFNLRTKTGMFFDASGQFEPFYSFTADEVEKLDDTNYRLERATFTACEDESRPPWSFDIKHADIEDGGYGRFKGVAMRVKGAPVFYMPYLLWPMKRERTAGLLTPSFGYSDRRGTYLGTSIYVPFGRSYDTTLSLDYFSEGYYGVGSEWRWAPVTGATGELSLYSIWDPAADRWQWKVHGRHEQDDFLGFRLQAEVEDLSDVDFFQEFERSYDAATRRYLYSYIRMSRSWGPYALTVLADRRTTIFSSGDVQLNQLPEVELRVRSTRIGRTPLYWSMISSVNLFDVDRGNGLAASYARADLFPKISYSLPGPLWLSVTPRLAGRVTYYTKQQTSDRQSYVDEPIDRTYVEAGVDIVGPSLSRVFNRAIGPYSRFKHLIEPRIEYSYVSSIEDQNLIPTFDEVDSVLVLNKAKLSLANRLLARSRKGVTAQEIASFELFQEYSFDEPLNQGDGVRTSQRGPLGASLRVTPAPGLTFDTRTSWDTLFNTLTSFSMSAGVYRGPIQTNTTWFESYNSQDGSRQSSQAGLMLGFRKQGFPLTASVQVAYDIERQETQRQQLKIGYQGSCWSVAAEYRDLRTAAYPTRDYLLVVSLKGVGALPEIKGSLSGPGG